MEKSIVYCDESGNSGPNYLDADQPFYVLAGFVAPESALVEASVAILDAIKEVCPERGELKAEAFMKGPTQMRAAVKLIRKLGALGLIPIWVAAEKRFCVAGKIIETFLDPAYNHLLGNNFTTDVRSKRELAQTLYDHLDASVLNAFAKAYRNPSRTSLENALEEVVASMKRLGAVEIATLAEGARPQLDEIAAIEAANTVLGKSGTTINLPCLVTFMMMVENLGRLGCCQPHRIVHDQQRTYEDGYRKAYEMHRHLGDWYRQHPAMELPHTGIEHIYEFDMRDSKENPMIQAADLLAGIVNLLLRKASRSIQLTTDEVELASLVAGALLIKEMPLAYGIWSDRLSAKIVGFLLKPVAASSSGSSPTQSERDYDSVGQWPSGLIAREVSRDTPTTETSAMLPIPAGPHQLTQNEGKFGFELPVFGFVGQKSHALMVLVNDEDEPTANESADGRTFPSVVPLFHDREEAQKFLNTLVSGGELNENQLLREFGAPQAVELWNLLREACRRTSAAVFDPMTARQTHVHLSNLTHGFGQGLSRAFRMIGSGLHNVIMQRHQGAGVNVISMLTSSGRYVAAIDPNGKLYEGSTREEAMRALCAMERIAFADLVSDAC